MIDPRTTPPRQLYELLPTGQKASLPPLYEPTTGIPNLGLRVHHSYNPLSVTLPHLDGPGVKWGMSRSRWKTSESNLTTGAD